MWIIFSIVASVFWGLDYTLTEKVLEKIRFPTLLTIELFFGFIAMLGITLASKSYKMDLPVLFASKQTITYIVLIVLVFNIANTFIVLAIGSSNATVAGLIEISYPLFVAFFSWLFFREVNLNVGTALGGAFILFGVSLIYFLNK
jgi:drug/metabolite transporter (DMT)-like permease